MTRVWPTGNSVPVEESGAVSVRFSRFEPRIGFNSAPIASTHAKFNAGRKQRHDIDELGSQWVANGVGLGSGWLRGGAGGRAALFLHPVTKYLLLRLLCPFFYL